MFKKILAKLKKQDATVATQQPTATDEMVIFLNKLKDIFAEELLIDPRIRDFELTTYGNSCRQRCNNILEQTTQLTEKIKKHINQHQELHAEKENFATFVNNLFTNLQQSSEKLHNILSQQEIKDKERQLKCYDLGMTVQQSTRTLINTYIAEFDKTQQ
ncbi:MAG: hypothetical protein OXB96_01030 [Candidatus Kaiserbacteria bacterium]|nr:hypothetical protein [Candidatus Kaiserbacteria bacterium]